MKFTLAALTPDGDAPWWFNLGTGLLLVVVALLLWFPAPYSRRDWPLDAALLLTSGVALGGSFLVTSESRMLSVGFILALFAVFAAYFRPFAIYLIELILMLSGYLLCVYVNPVFLHPAYLVFISAVVGATSMMVALLVRQLRTLALNDPLTGLLNRRGLELMAERIRVESLRSGAPVTVGILDLDDFKRLNDRDGHRAGDQRLIDVADDWRGGLRRNDVVARFGGDEFVVVIAGTSPDEAHPIAERISARRPGAWTIGFTDWDPTEDVYTAIQRADQALYESKQAR